MGFVAIGNVPPPLSVFGVVASSAVAGSAQDTQWAVEAALSYWDHVVCGEIGRFLCWSAVARAYLSLGSYPRSDGCGSALAFGGGGFGTAEPGRVAWAVAASRRSAADPAGPFWLIRHRRSDPTSSRLTVKAALGVKPPALKSRPSGKSDLFVRGSLAVARGYLC